ncbi:alcohol dehydrogenase catalytic domain-containing protein [uncultured Pseudoflavonifractor sp.]|uniref:alcohol dehydrogenase catalytic domain-containing protein n=1 Tax=uncultured Pseudoflavonifractor sp. TaxID=1221379 RepID=UPI0025F7BC9B|nr:alcohol dehydrogenase catalytic domain-containing protein [uncultured Pseudoflavonifractor sp.]
MKALYLTGKAQVEMRDIPVPECPDDGLLIKIDSVGLCGSDVRTYSVGSAKINYPVILGHENAGYVEKVGKNVTGWKVGDKVVANPAIPCGKCYYCVNKMPGLCDNIQVAGTSFPGGFAQYMVFPGDMLSRGQIIKVPDDADLEPMILAELLASVVKAQDDLKVGMGETVVIVGSGPIGCLHAQIARLHGATKIIMAELNKERLDKCHEFGGTHFIVSSQEDLVQRVMEITDGRGADVCIVACPSAKPHQQGVELLRKEGRLCLFGGLPKDNPWTTMDGNLIHYKRLRIFGAYSYSAADFAKGYELLAAGRIDTRIITHTLPLEKMPEGVRMIQQGEAIKVVLKPWMEE